jgi:hypothetical protein
MSNAVKSFEVHTTLQKIASTLHRVKVGPRMEIVASSSLVKSYVLLTLLLARNAGEMILRNISYI